MEAYFADPAVCSAATRTARRRLLADAFARARGMRG